MNAFRITINRQIFTEIMSSNYGYGMDLKTSRIYPAVDWISGGGENRTLWILILTIYCKDT